MKTRKSSDFAPLTSFTRSANLKSMSSTSFSTTKRMWTRKISRSGTYFGKIQLMLLCRTKVVSKSTTGIIFKSMRYLTVTFDSTWLRLSDNLFATALMVVKILENVPATRKIINLWIRRTTRFCRRGVEKWSPFRRERRIVRTTRYSVTMSATLAAAATRTCARTIWSLHRTRRSSSFWSAGFKRRRWSRCGAWSPWKRSQQEPS